MTAHHRMQFAPPISPDDLFRHVLAAYYRACGDATPPIDYPASEVADWSSPVTFTDAVIAMFELRVRADLHLAGVADYMGAVDRLQRWTADLPYGQQHVSAVDPSLWAEVQAMAHGCAAVDVGGGTASVASHLAGDAFQPGSSAASTLQNPLFTGDTS